MKTSAKDERDLLLGHLTRHRRHVLDIVEGLSDEQLRRSVLPSGWNCLSMISHLTWDVEAFWLAAVVAGRQSAIEALEGRDAWRVEATAAEVVAGYRDAIARSDDIIGGTDLDAPPAWWPGELFGDWRLNTLREILLHMISECACHAGHLDAARELIDGRQFLVLT